METLPINFAILQLVEDIPGVRNGRYPDLGALGLAEADHAHYLDAMEALGICMFLGISIICIVGELLYIGFIFNTIASVFPLYSVSVVWISFQDTPPQNI